MTAGSVELLVKAVLRVLLVSFEPRHRQNAEVRRNKRRLPSTRNSPFPLSLSVRPPLLYDDSDFQSLEFSYNLPCALAGLK